MKIKYTEHSQNEFEIDVVQFAQQAWTLDSGTKTLSLKYFFGNDPGCAPILIELTTSLLFVDDTVICRDEETLSELYKRVVERMDEDDTVQAEEYFTNFLETRKLTL